MRKALLLLLAVAGCWCAQAQVHFETCSTDALRAKAEQGGKLVFIDLYATWCGPCRYMERTVFASQQVTEFMNRHFVVAKYDVDQSTGAQLMRRYGNGSIPCYVIFNTRGEQLGRMVGACSEEEFLSELRRILPKGR